MMKRLWSGVGVGVLAAGLLVVLAGGLLAAEGPPKGTAPPPAGAPGQPEQVRTPEQEAADAYLEKYQREREVAEKEKRFLADQHVRVGKDKFDMGDFRGALRDYEKAMELSPDNKDAQEGLKKTRNMLSMAEKRFGDMAKEYAEQRTIALDMERMTLSTMFADAKGLFEKGHYADAVEAFTRTAAKGRYLSPNIDVGKIVEDSEVYIQRSMSKMEEKRQAEGALNEKRALEEGEKLRKQRQKLLEERSAALYQQATTLFAQRRFDECRKACDEILLKDPANGAAQALRESAVAAANNQEIDRQLKARKVETESEWNRTRAMEVPQLELVYMPRDRFEEVRSRVATTAIGGEKVEAAPWEAKIREAMNKKIAFDFVETPLADVVTFISSLVDVTIVLDHEALKDENKTVTLKVSDMRLEAALNWVLRLVGLKYTLKDEAIFVSKPERIYDKPVMRMYDVTDLTIDIKNFQGRQQALASDGGYASTGSQGSGGGGGQGQSTLGQDFFGSEDEAKNEQEKLTGQTLVDFIKKTIAPGTWADDEGIK